jgi:hypothetical protein
MLQLYTTASDAILTENDQRGPVDVMNIVDAKNDIITVCTVAKWT